MLTDNIKSTFKDAAQKLRGPAKRAFMANVTNDYFDGSSRKVESHLGWSRHTVPKGLKELETGFVCLDNYAARGRKKTEENFPTLEADIHHLCEFHELMRLRERSIKHLHPFFTLKKATGDIICCDRVDFYMN